MQVFANPVGGLTRYKVCARILLYTGPETLLGVDGPVFFGS